MMQIRVPLSTVRFLVRGKISARTSNSPHPISAKREKIIGVKTK